MEGHCHLWLHQEHSIKCKPRFCGKLILENMFSLAVQFHVARDFELWKILSLFNSQVLWSCSLGFQVQLVRKDQEYTANAQDSPRVLKGVRGCKGTQK